MDFLSPWMKNIGGIVVGRASHDQAVEAGWWQYENTPALVMTSRPMKASADVLVAKDPGGGTGAAEGADEDTAISGCSGAG